MPNIDIDPEDVAAGTAVGASARAARRNRRRGPDDDGDDDDFDTNTPGSLWRTGLVVVGALVVMLALVITLSQ